MSIVQLQPDAGEPGFAQYAITATAINLANASILGNNVVPRRLTLTYSSTGTAVMYVGGSAVAATPANAGMQLAAGARFTFENQAPSSIYVVGTENAANILYVTAEY